MKLYDILVPTIIKQNIRYTSFHCLLHFVPMQLAVQRRIIVAPPQHCQTKQQALENFYWYG